MTLHLEVHGRVQGVGFRWYVLETARRLDLAGWVRNRRDGAVEVAAEGTADTLRQLREVVEQGPPGAAVRMVRELPTSDLGALPHPFTVIH
ncbi:MAG TPA: acylphosphatase [Gemmatimonadaceae bacterium]|nr:acylphosphatase [Gemmatimonadaceae bacterium]